MTGLTAIRPHYCSILLRLDHEFADLVDDEQFGLGASIDCDQSPVATVNSISQFCPEFFLTPSAKWALKMSKICVFLGRQTPRAISLGGRRGVAWSENA